MDVLLATESTTTANIVRGAFKQSQSENITVVEVHKVTEFPEEFKAETVVLVDWEMNQDLGVGFVTKAKEINSETPVLLLCPKSKSGSTFSGMKVGASGVINKPIDTDDMLNSIASAVRRSSHQKQQLNVEFINPFIDATKNVFATMCSISITRKKLFLKADHKMFGDISGVMGLSGDAVGSVVVSLPRKLACLVVGRMLGEEPGTEVNADVCDAIGELINMISGQAKAALVKTKYHFTISIPSVVSGQGHEISHKQGTPNVVVLFEAEGMDFVLQVCLTPTDNGGN